MRREIKDTFDPSQPSLVVTYGNTSRKQRALEGDLLLLGRAPFCDINLASSDVSPIHCVLAKTESGWRVRDCTGRSATRLNGQPIHDEPLRDGDTLQIGGFSFRLNLPGGIVSRARTRPVERLERSRRQLARRALKLREQLLQRHESQSGLAAELVRKQQEVHQQVEQLQQRLHEYELRRTQLDRAERELAKEREKFDRDTERFQDRFERLEAERETSQRQAETLLAERTAALERRAAELDLYSEHLRRRREQTRDRDRSEEVAHVLATLERLCRELTTDRELAPLAP